MSQGKAFTPEQRESIIQSLKTYLEMGFSRNKACNLIGLPPTTLSNWTREDESLSIKLQGWENTLNALAISNIASALQKESEVEDNKKETSKWWLERKLKDDGFTTKTETDVTSQGQQLGVVILPVKNDSTMETTTETSDSSK
jgi:hypothetical protein